MKKILTLLSIIATIACAAAAEAAPEPAAAAPFSFALSGTVDPSVSYYSRNDGCAFLNPNIPNLSPFSSMGAAGEIDGKLKFSREYTSLGLLDFSYRDRSMLDHSSGATLESMSFTVNELYSDLNFGDLFYLRLGKQRLSWGSGYVFNPSDPINPPKDPTNQRAILEGVPALKAEIIAKPVSLMLFSVMYDSFEELGYGAKLSSSAVPNSDISVSGFWSPSQSWTGALNASVAPLYELPGWDTVQVWFEGSAYAQGRYEAYADGSLAGSPVAVAPTGAQYAALLGTSATIPVLETVALAEYYHLSEGMSSSQLSSVYKALRSSDSTVVYASSAWYGELARRPGRQASDYLFASLTQSTITDSGDAVFDKIGLGLSCLVNLVDGSTYATGDISFTYVKDTSVDLTCAWAAGGDDSEFGNTQAKLSLGLEVKVFF